MWAPNFPGSRKFICQNPSNVRGIRQGELPEESIRCGIALMIKQTQRNKGQARGNGGVSDTLAVEN